MKISFKERMKGRLFDGKKRIPAEFSVKVTSYCLKDLISGEFQIEGELLVNAVPQRSSDYPGQSVLPLQGTQKIDILRRKLIYEFRYGHLLEYTFKGEKNVKLLGPLQFLETMTCLPGEVTYPGGERKELAYFHFNIVKDLIPMILSLRIQL